MNDDIFLAIEVLVVISCVAFFLSIAALAASLVFLFKAREKLRRIGQGPARDSNGRKIQERI